jgi:hypothetical protein
MKASAVTIELMRVIYRCDPEAAHASSLRQRGHGHRDEGQYPCSGGVPSNGTRDPINVILPPVLPVGLTRVHNNPLFTPSTPGEENARTSVPGVPGVDSRFEYGRARVLRHASAKPALAPRDTHCMGTSGRGPLPSLTT